MPHKKNLTYKDTGVSYDVMDPLKRMAQLAGLNTVKNFKNKNVKELPLSRGESAHVIELPDMYIASVIEGLGTKNTIAEFMRHITGRTYYDSLAQDTVAMIVNDLITVGAKPINILAYWAAGSADWFTDKKRMEDLVKGWANACIECNAIWGGGETPTLSGIIAKDVIDLGGSCYGIIQPKSRLTLGENLTEGDMIVLLESSGIHANGLTLARKIAEQLPKGFATKMRNGSLYGDALLTPTILYAKLVDKLFENDIDIHYMANITGHGWRKLMRYKHPFTYRITDIPPIPEVFSFMIEQGPLDEKEAFGNLNMGAGFALYVPQKEIKKVIKIAKENNINAYNAGIIENGTKQVIIEPKKIVFAGNTLQVKA